MSPLFPSFLSVSRVSGFIGMYLTIQDNIIFYYIYFLVHKLFILLLPRIVFCLGAELYMANHVFGIGSIAFALSQGPSPGMIFKSIYLYSITN